MSIGEEHAVVWDTSLSLPKPVEGSIATYGDTRYEVVTVEESEKGVITVTCRRVGLVNTDYEVAP